jgi:dual specificity protein kinase YAK1
MLTISRNRYLILDVLGQGTFGQVVKCQNLKTQEVVAVKVVKNRTAYFNQSMMEVSVLDLVGTQLSKLSSDPAYPLLAKHKAR